METNAYPCVWAGSALERIARDSPADHWTVMEVLCAHVREYRPGQADQEVADGSDPDLPDRRFNLPKAFQDLSNDMHRLKIQAKKNPPIPTAIQAVCDVLKRRKHEREDEPQKLNLYRAYLKGASLKGAHLDNATLAVAMLDRTFLTGARLEHTDLAGSLGLSQAQLNTTCGDAHTTLPKSLTRPEHWPEPKPSDA